MAKQSKPAPAEPAEYVGEEPPDGGTYPVAGWPPNYPGSGLMVPGKDGRLLRDAGFTTAAATVGCYTSRNELVDGSQVAFEVSAEIREFTVPEGYAYTKGASYARLDVPALDLAFLAILPNPDTGDHAEGYEAP